MAVTENPTVLWKPHPGFQTDFLANGAFEVLGGGAAGPGKTDCLIIKASELAKHPKSRMLFLRTILKPDLIDVEDRMRHLFPQLGADYDAGDRRWTFPSGATLELGYGKNYKELQRYFGREYTAIFFDELGLLAEERAWTALLSRIRSTDPTVPLRARASANPGQAGHAWLKKRFVTPTKKGLIIFHDRESQTTRAFVAGTARDNPSLAASYWIRLNLLPEPLRSQLRDGDWDSGSGMALPQLSRAAHLIEPFSVPPYWRQFGAFDWGYQHPFCFGWFAVNEDGDLFLVDTVWGRLLLTPEIGERIRDRVPVVARKIVYSGLDTFHEHHARSEHKERGPTIAEMMAREGVFCVPADVSRKKGLNAIRMALRPRPNNTPVLRIMNTPGNERLFTQLEGMVTDPDDMEDALKVDAVDGEGGDDGYDMLKNACLSRPGVSKPLENTAPFQPSRLNDPNVLAAEANRQQTVQHFLKVRRSPLRGQVGIDDPELGGYK